MQPADAFDCVEVICATATTDESLERACDAVTATAKLPIVLRRPIEGFLFNRLQHALLHEAYVPCIPPRPSHSTHPGLVPHLRLRGTPSLLGQGRGVGLRRLSSLELFAATQSLRCTAGTT